MLNRRTILAQVSQAESVVGTGVVVSGKLEAKNNIQINGAFTGEVISEDDIIIGEHGEVNGPVSAKNMTVAGTINGDVNVINELEIMSTGRIMGNISCKSLSIKPGGILNGKSIMHAALEDQKIVKPTYETE